MAEILAPLHVLVRFGAEVPITAQGGALLAFEKALRDLSGGLHIEVFKEKRGDDSKLRAAMTEDQRAKL